MGALRAGDSIFGRDGRVVRVTIAHPVEPAPESYRVTFDDGSVILADAEHRWLTFDANELGALTRRDPEWRARRRLLRPSRSAGGVQVRAASHITPSLPAPTGTIRTTAEIAATLTVRGGTRANHAVPVAGAIDLPDADLPLDPYLLGLWLGDGNSAGGGYTTADDELLEAWRAGGFTVVKWSGKYAYGVNGLMRILGRLGVLKDTRSPNPRRCFAEKHVPAQYLRASRAQRLALLQGLMDTDGHACESGAVEFTSCNRTLADDALEIALSLGHKAALCEGRATIDGRDCGPKYRIKWRPSDVVFRLSRKVARQRTEGRRTTRFRYITGCEWVGPVPMRCITVDAPDGLFLAGRQFVPTHNSDALIMEALKDVKCPGFSALILRKTFSDLALPGAIMDRTREWLHGAGAKWTDTTKTYSFSTTGAPATITFGFLEHENDKFRYQGAEFQLVCFDELTQFLETQYRYLLSRIRKTTEMHGIIPRARAASNPGGQGHEWVMDRFIQSAVNERGEKWEDGCNIPLMSARKWCRTEETSGETRADRVFIPSKLSDNPFVDPQYRAQLNELDLVTRAQLLEGDWSIRPSGNLFRPEWFTIVDAVPTPHLARRHRYWDCAAGDKGAGRKADWSVGGRVALVRGDWYVEDVRRGRWKPKQLEDQVLDTAKEDGRKVEITMEQEPGASGVQVIDHFSRMLVGFVFRGEKKGYKKAAEEGGSTQRQTKVELARPWSAAAERGRIHLVRGPWNKAFLDEVMAFPYGGHDDQCDSVFGAMRQIANRVAPSFAGIPMGEPLLPRRM